MKQLVLIRHAKSSWENFSVTDFERPLNERGNRDAPMMAQRLVDRAVPIDCFISSPARRAIKTASYFASAYGVGKSSLQLIDSLYLAAPAVFSRVISEVQDSCNCLAVFSHNNGLTDFANQLTDVRIDNIPTCGIFAIHIDTVSWKHFADAAKSFWFFDYPKSGLTF